MRSVRRTLELDPRMIRHSVVKLGDRLRDAKGSTEKHGAMAERDGSVPWSTAKDEDLDMAKMVGKQGRMGARVPGGELDLGR
jgi:hypothetical protein